MLLLLSATYLRQGNVFTSICHSVHRGCWQTPPCACTPPARHPLGQTLLWQTPPGQTPLWADTPGHKSPWADTPWADTRTRQTSPTGQTPPLGRHPPGRHPPWPDNPPPADNPLQTATAADGTHLTGMHSCFIRISHCHNLKRALCCRLFGTVCTCTN